MIEKLKRIINSVISALIVNDSYQVPSLINFHIQSFRKIHGYYYSQSLTNDWGKEMTGEYVATRDISDIKPKVMEMLEGKSTLPTTS